MLHAIFAVCVVGIHFSVCTGQSIIQNKDGLQLSLNLFQKDDSTVLVHAKLTNKLNERLFILKIDPNEGASFNSPEEVLIDMMNPYDPLHTSEFFIDLYQIDPGDSIEVIKFKHTKLNKLRLIQFQVELFGRNQLSSASSDQKLLRAFNKSVKEGNPRISVKHYVKKKSYNGIIFRVEL